MNIEMLDSRGNGLTQEHLKKHLHYSPQTGVFSRLIANSSASKIGDLAGWKTKLGYIDLKIDGTTYKAHRLVFLYAYGEIPSCDIDHINMDRADNRLANLRAATRSQNQCNRTKLSSNKTGFKGVSFHKATNKFVAQCAFKNQKHHIGLFDTPEAASTAYQKFTASLQGEFARS